MTTVDAAQAPLCLPPRPPSQASPGLLPPGACDCHMHVFGPGERYRLAAGRSYTPSVVTIDDYRAVMTTLGIARAVLVQPSVYGTDNSCLLDALASDPANLRGVVVVAPMTGDGEFDRLHGLGVRGIRINRRNPGGLGLEAIAGLGRRIARLGWHIQLQIDLSALPDLDALCSTAPVPLVIDHFGFPNLADGIDGRSFQTLLRMLSTGRIWLKLSAPYRFSKTGHPYADAAPFTGALLRTRPDRLLWATDWPHTELWTQMPDDADLVTSSPLWAGSQDLKRMIFVDNPARLYWPS